MQAHAVASHNSIARVTKGFPISFIAAVSFRYRNLRVGSLRKSQISACIRTRTNLKLKLTRARAFNAATCSVRAAIQRRRSCRRYQIIHYADASEPIAAGSGVSVKLRAAVAVAVVVCCSAAIRFGSAKITRSLAD